MKKTILFFGLLPMMAYGQTDSLNVRELDEVVVAAQMQRTDSQKSVYIPGTRQKEASPDGYALLGRMQIPQLSVNPLSQAVKTASGEGVELYINGMPASTDDVAGLNPQDVRRVEYMDFPADARYRRAPHAVNFVVARYEYGGYTKLTAKERFIVNSGNVRLYSKMAYREMDYDLIATAGYEATSHTGADLREIYRLPAGDVTRCATMQSGKYRGRDLYAAFRAKWQHKGVTLRNKIGYTGSFIPANIHFGEVSIWNQSVGYTQSVSSRSNAIDWLCNLNVDFGKGWSLSANLSASYSRNRSNQEYQEILNYARERDVATRRELQINKALSESVSVFLQSITVTDASRVAYTGSSDATNRFNVSAVAPLIGASVNIGKVYGSADAGFAYEHNSINGYVTTDYYPFVHANIQYSPDPKNSLGLYVQYATMSPGIAMKSPNILQENEILYITGNPDLKNSRHTSVALNYTWLPSNQWQLTGYAVMFRIADRQVPIYTPAGPAGMMLKRYGNNGDYNHGQIGASATGRFLDGRLAASVAPRLLLYHTTGAYRESRYPLSCTVNIDCYLRDFHFSLYWSTPGSYLDGEDCFYRRMPSEYAVSAGWNRRGWNVELMGANLLRSSWITSRGALTTPGFDCNRTDYGADRHRRLSLTITYTLGYGRKVAPSNELLPTTPSPASNILK